MKKLVSIMLCIAVLLCTFSSVIPSFALSYNNFTYEIVDESVIITGYIGSETTVVVPSQIDGLNVYKISDNAFKDNKNITSVTVNSGIKDIGASAFENCTALATISLPDTIIHIGEKAIYNTAYYNDKSNWRLKTVGSEDAYIEWEDISAPVLEYLYLGKILIKIELVGLYSVRSGTTVIADGAFKGNKNASQVWLPTSIVAIGNNAFDGCESIYRIKNLNIVQYIGDYAFSNCKSFENFDIGETANFNSNAFYNTGYYNNPDNWHGNALYYNNKVIGVNENSDIVEIKDGITEIISGALLDKNVVIPESVVKISDTAFTDESKVSVFGYSNSYAQEYANLNNIKFIAIDTFEKGDLNFDSVIDYDDYEIICNLCSTQKEENDIDIYIGDLDNDGAVDGVDAIILDLIINGMPPSRQKGDVNGDGKVDMTDYDLLVSIVTIQDRITDNIMIDRCDINEDGAVDSFDVVYLDLYLKNLMPIV